MASYTEDELDKNSIKLLNEIGLYTFSQINQTEKNNY